MYKLFSWIRFACCNNGKSLVAAHFQPFRYDGPQLITRHTQQFNNPPTRKIKQNSWMNAQTDLRPTTPLPTSKIKTSSTPTFPWKFSCCILFTSVVPWPYVSFTGLAISKSFGRILRRVAGKRAHVHSARTAYLHHWTDAIHVHSTTALLSWKYIRSRWISNLDKRFDGSSQSVTGFCSSSIQKSTTDFTCLSH